MKQHPVAILPILSFALAIPMCAQDTTRHIWDTAFLAPKTEKNTKSQAARKPRYTVLTPKVPFQNVDPSTVVGITVWRLQEHRTGDAGERLLGHNGSKTVELEPKRVSAQTLFNKYDKVRITVETAREGYLYIVDRERYANGKQGEPYLIFPVTTIRGGENHVLPGHIFELPAQDDDAPYFDMQRSRPDQVGEQITLLITPAPLKDLAPKEDRQRLAPEQYVQFEKESDISVGIAEATANQRLGWSKEEKSAGRDPAVGLSATAPLPQTLFYGPDSSAQKPTMVNLVLTYAPLARPSKPVR